MLPEVTASPGISRVSKTYDIFCDLRDSNKQVVELTYTKKKQRVDDFSVGLR